MCKIVKISNYKKNITIILTCFSYVLLFILIVTKSKCLFLFFPRNSQNSKISKELI